MMIAVLSELQMKAKERERKHERFLLCYRANKTELKKKHVTEANGHSEDGRKSEILFYTLQRKSSSKS